MRTVRSVFLLIGVLCGLSAAREARAEDRWTTPFTGVRKLARVSTSERTYALVVDLCAAGVRVRATAPSERGRTPSSFASLVGADAVVNADFFSLDGGYRTSGVAVGNGHAWPDSDDDRTSAYFAFGSGRVAISRASAVTPAPAWASQAVSGHPEIVVDGQALDFATTSTLYGPHPRTALGVTRDGRKLIVLVTDGRDGAVNGMTLPELGRAMRGLGAWYAVNLDGGGSSAMWVRGTGVLNQPSDGSQRVVANHLGIFADGSGAPGSCDWSWDEAIAQGDAIETGGTTDIDGDGRADVCARGSAGFDCSTSSGAPFDTSVLGPALADAGGWNDESNWASVRMGDIDGDGRADLCARANAGIRCWRSTGSAFGPAIEGPALDDADGWGARARVATIRLADIDGDGRADLCARGAAAMRCWRSTASGFGAAIEGPAWSDASGWNEPSHYGTIRIGDVNGDGLADVCGRSRARFECHLSDGGGFPTVVEGPAWSDAAGWDAVSQWSTIRLADLDGDGLADVCARSTTGLACHRSLGRSFGPAILGPALTDTSGWADHANYATIRMGDVDASGGADVCARGNAGWFCWPFDAAAGAFASRVTGPALSDATGWNALDKLRSIRMADFDGDGRSDVCARGAAGVSCWPSITGGFGPAVDGPRWSDAAGWDAVEHYGTLRIAGGACGASCEEPVEVPDAGMPAVGADAGTAREDAGVASDDAAAAPDAAARPDSGGAMASGCAVSRWVDGHGAVAPVAVLVAWMALAARRSRRQRS